MHRDGNLHEKSARDDAREELPVLHEGWKIRKDVDDDDDYNSGNEQIEWGADVRFQGGAKDCAGCAERARRFALARDVPWRHLRQERDDGRRKRTEVSNPN